jgi:hypothetical protein
MSYPCVNDEATGRCEYKPARLTIEFGLLQDGRVDYVRVTKKAEWQVYARVDGPGEARECRRSDSCSVRVQSSRDQLAALIHWSRRVIPLRLNNPVSVGSS